jgi:hypothetical protein
MASQGTQGATGTGTQGTTGAQGAPGTAGGTGAQGAAGATGAQGASGAAGLSNNVNNYVVTATGDGTTPLNGEVNLQFDSGTNILSVTGAIRATGDITAYYTSDARHKDNIQVIENALDKVKKLNGVIWEWNQETTDEVTKSLPNTGLIAQEVKEVLPEVVIERQDGYLAIDYSKMLGLLVEAIKELDKKIS